MTGTFRIRKAQGEDLSEILRVYERARRFMRENGNPDQWGDGYPKEELLRSDIENGILYVLTDGGRILGVFAMFVGADPTYAVIEEGNWLCDAPYAVIHRIASAGIRPGVLEAAVSYALGQNGHVRIDTHRDNTVMLHLLAKLGFSKCGIIYLENGDPRIAYEKI